MVLRSKQIVKINLLFKSKEFNILNKYIIILKLDNFNKTKFSELKNSSKINALLPILFSFNFISTAN